MTSSDTLFCVIRDFIFREQFEKDDRMILNTLLNHLPLELQEIKSDTDWPIPRIKEIDPLKGPTALTLRQWEYLYFLSKVKFIPVNQNRKEAESLFSKDWNGADTFFNSDIIDYISNLLKHHVRIDLNMSYEGCIRKFLNTIFGFPLLEAFETTQYTLDDTFLRSSLKEMTPDISSLTQPQLFKKDANIYYYMVKKLLIENRSSNLQLLLMSSLSGHPLPDKLKIDILYRIQYISNIANKYECKDVNALLMSQPHLDLTSSTEIITSAYQLPGGREDNILRAIQELISIFEGLDRSYFYFFLNDDELHHYVSQAVNYKHNRFFLTIEIIPPWIYMDFNRFYKSFAHLLNKRNYNNRFDVKKGYMFKTLIHFLLNCLKEVIDDTGLTLVPLTSVTAFIWTLYLLFEFEMCSHLKVAYFNNQFLFFGELNELNLIERYLQHLTLKGFKFFNFNFFDRFTNECLVYNREIYEFPSEDEEEDDFDTFREPPKEPIQSIMIALEANTSFG